MEVTDGQIQLKFMMYRQIFNVNTGIAIKMLDPGMNVTRAVSEKHKLFGPNCE